MLSLALSECKESKLCRLFFCRISAVFAIELPELKYVFVPSLMLCAYNYVLFKGCQRSKHFKPKLVALEPCDLQQNYYKLLTTTELRLSDEGIWLIGRLKSCIEQPFVYFYGR
jgi:hypothetical protein